MIVAGPQALQIPPTQPDSGLPPYSRATVSEGCRFLTLAIVAPMDGLALIVDPPGAIREPLMTDTNAVPMLPKAECLELRKQNARAARDSAGKCVAIPRSRTPNDANFSPLQVPRMGAR